MQPAAYERYTYVALMTMLPGGEIRNYAGGGGGWGETFDNRPVVVHWPIRFETRASGAGRESEPTRGRHVTKQ